jgi:hypothetical protein
VNIPIGFVEKVVWGAKACRSEAEIPHCGAFAIFLKIHNLLNCIRLIFLSKPHPAKGGVHSSLGFSTSPLGEPKRFFCLPKG